MEPYEIDEGKIKWATKRVKAMRGALTEIPNAIIGLKRAEGGMKKAANGCKAFPESDVMRSFEAAIQKMITDLTDFQRDWEDDTNALQAGVFKFVSEVQNNERPES